MTTLIIGLTGGIGSGKTTVTNMFINLGIDVVDADVVAREVVMPKSLALIQIGKYFGSEYIKDNGELDRSMLRTRVFSDDKGKLWLNNLLHPLIRSEMLSQLKSTTSPYCLLVAPLLLENKLQSLVNRVLVIDVKEETQLLRTTSRDTSTAEEIKSIMASQVSRQERLKGADDIIDNDTPDLKLVSLKVDAFHKKYLLMSGSTFN